MGHPMDHPHILALTTSSREDLERPGAGLTSISSAARCGLAYLRLGSLVPDRGFPAVGADGNRLLAVLLLDVQNSSFAVADPFAHSCVDQKEDAIPLEHLADVTLRSVSKQDPAGAWPCTKWATPRAAVSA